MIFRLNKTNNINVNRFDYINDKEYYSDLLKIHKDKFAKINGKKNSKNITNNQKNIDNVLDNSKEFIHKFL